MGYSDHTTRSISSVKELQPGDHIRVPRALDHDTENPTSVFSSISSQPTAALSSASKKPTSALSSASKSSAAVLSSSSFRPTANLSCICCSCCICCNCCPLKSTSDSNTISGIPYEPCDENSSITHHLLVVEAIDDEHVKVIHKVTDGVVEQVKRYRPRHVTVLDYESQYSREEAIQRAREKMSKGEEYKLASNNCEHFVTEVRTGEKLSRQIQGAVGGMVGVGTGGAIAGGAAGAGAGALIGAGIGSVVPVAGTLMGAGIGAIVGGIAGGSAGGTGGAAGGAKLGIIMANEK